MTSQRPAVAHIEPAPELLANVEAEAALLGALLIDNGLVDHAREWLAAEDFVEPLHARIFAAVVARVESGQSASPPLLAPEFRDDPALTDLGGLNYLAQLTTVGQGLLAPREFAEQVHELACRRRMRDALKSGLEAVHDLTAPPGAIVAEIEASLAGTAAHKSFALLDLESLEQEPPEPRAFALAKFIPRGELTLFTGPGGSSKSLFGQQLATSVAAGLPFLGLATMQASALYLTAEDDARELHWRQSHIARRLGVPVNLPGLHLASLRGRLGNELCTFDAEGRLSPSPSFGLLRGTIRSTKAKFVVLDNVGHLFPGNENDRSQVTQFANLLNRLGSDTDATILLIAHPNKSGDSYSGSTAWLNSVRSQIVLDWRRDSEGEIPDPDARELRLGKANYSRAGETLAFRWHDFALVRDEDLPEDTRAELAATILAASDNEVFLCCLDERNRQERPVSERKASRTYAPKEFADMAESKGIGRARLEAAMDRLFRLGAIERGFIFRDHGEGKDRYGLRRASADLSDDLPLTGSADLRSPHRRPPLTHTSPLRGETGAPHEGAAPVPERPQL